ncbi:MAG: argininosuccinate lyase [Pseudomonadota bacterium]|nr:argininosuccinate lyase [Pseudomonadota bacterium]MDO7710653.1 argininosuccinate lyase [Pseudomonadota bacterium]
MTSTSTATTPKKKLSSARLTQPTNAFVEEFTASVQFDKRMYRQDIQGSIAHATMLESVGVLSNEECTKIIAGLDTIQIEIENDDFEWSIAQEDVHMNIEARLIALIGEVGKKLHTGRSRNDQVATDVRLYLRDMIQPIRSELFRLQDALLNVAEREADTIMPGFTHLQTAQPITFGHHMLAWYEMLVRDAERLDDCEKRVNSLPLGAAALAGTTFPIDRELTAKLLGFERICLNSLDAVSDRDFAIEFTSFASLLMMHMSRFSEELIIWSSAQFDFVDLGDAFCTGSSIMPQKKNPDVPELIRGKTSRVYGNMFNLFTLMKNQPLAYNKDNQEDKEPLFDTIDTLLGSLRVYADMMGAISVKADNMRNAALRGYATATDLADYLVRKGVAFRDAHEVVGLSVAYGIKHKKDLSELSLQELQTFSAQISDDVFEVLTLEGSVAARDHLGGTAPNQVRAAIRYARSQRED